MFAVQSLSKTIVLLFLFLGVANVSTKRVQRTLIYPAPRSKIQMIYGVGLPVALEDISVTMGYVVKANYYLPINVSDYTEPEIILQRKRRNNVARWNLYKLLSHFLQRFGGKSCILRSICEFVHMPLDTNFGVIEEILHLIFRPSATNEYFIDPMDKEYVAAENIGRIARNGCRSIYRDCTFNMVDLFTKLM